MYRVVLLQMDYMLHTEPHQGGAIYYTTRCEQVLWVHES